MSVFCRFVSFVIHFYIYVPYHNRIVLYFRMFTCYDFRLFLFFARLFNTSTVMSKKKTHTNFSSSFLSYSNDRLLQLLVLMVLLPLLLQTFFFLHRFIVFVVFFLFPLVMLCDRFGYAFLASTHHTSSCRAFGWVCVCVCVPQ